ncbi:hypothetical protein BH18ACT1_BH18ACT1_02410 [soil metagenome]
MAPVGDRTGFLDATVVALAAGTLAFLLVVEPASGDAGFSSAEILWTVLPVALDVAMLAMASRLAFSLRVRPPAYQFVYLAVGGAMTVDVIDSLLETALGGEVGRAEDVIFMASFACWAAAAMRRGPVAPGPTSAVRYLGARRLAVLITCAVMPLLALVVQELRGRRPDTMTLVVTGLAGLSIGTLVAIRISGVIGATRDLVAVQGRERFAAMVENASDVIIHRRC